MWNNVSVEKSIIQQQIFDYMFSIHECAADLIRDISDATFDELVKYKIYQNNNMNFNHSPSEIAFAMSNKFNSKE